MTDTPNAPVLDAPLPCPFCGKEAVTTLFKFMPSDSRWLAHCPDESCVGHDTEEQSCGKGWFLAGWNRRAALPPSVPTTEPVAGGPITDGERIDAIARTVAATTDGVVIHDATPDWSVVVMNDGEVCGQGEDVRGALDQMVREDRIVQKVLADARNAPPASAPSGDDGEGADEYVDMAKRNLATMEDEIDAARFALYGDTENTMPLFIGIQQLRTVNQMRRRCECGVLESALCEDCDSAIAEVHVDDPDTRQVCFVCALAAAWKVERAEVEKWLIHPAAQPASEDATAGESRFPEDGVSDPIEALRQANDYIGELKREIDYTAIELASLRRAALPPSVPVATEPVACPKCGGTLHRVVYSGGVFNRDQWESMRAGDWYCETCPDRAEGVRYRYFWNSEIAAPPASAPTPALSVTASREAVEAAIASATCGHVLDCECVIVDGPHTPCIHCRNLAELVSLALLVGAPTGEVQNG